MFSVYAYSKTCTQGSCPSACILCFYILDLVSLRCGSSHTIEDVRPLSLTIMSDLRTRCVILVIFEEIAIKTTKLLSHNIFSYLQ